MGFIAVCIGVSCAGLSGLRATVPVFLLGYLAQKYPDTVPLNDNYSWLRESWYKLHT